MMKRTIEICNKIISGELNPIIGARKIAYIRYSENLDGDEDIVASTAVDSSTDHLDLRTNDCYEEDPLLKAYENDVLNYCKSFLERRKIELDMISEQ